VRQKNGKDFFSLARPESDLRFLTNQLLYLLSYASLDQIGTGYSSPFLKVGQFRQRAMAVQWHSPYIWSSSIGKILRSFVKGYEGRWEMERLLGEFLQVVGSVCHIGQVAAVALCTPTTSMSLLPVICAIQQVCDVDDGG
jgi:hypothetical protein